VNTYLIFAIGFTAQLLFSARMIVQWIKSEIAGRVLSPVLFWQFSLAGSVLLIIYGTLRQDLVIAAGQFITFCIYIRNLVLLKGPIKNPGAIISACIFFSIIAISGILLKNNSTLLSGMLHNRDISSLLFIWGSIGQFIFSLRFVYQWAYSERRKESILPLGFWILSLSGSVMLIVYAIVRRDPVIFLGQVFGAVIYSRNILIHQKHKKQHIPCPTI
jgi:lipid-A-disaccharide synthase-like uncharacterized protein